MDIGFIGLGTMGTPMALNLAAGGHKLFVHDAVAVPPVLQGTNVVECKNCCEVAEAAEIVVVMVPDTPDVKAALFADNGVAQGLSAGKLVVDMSSISPTATVEFATRIGELGCAYLDAPVSGGHLKAEDGTLTIMVGGPQEAFDRALPVLQLMGSTVTLIGTRNGDGQVAKAANQIIVGITIEAVAEALTFAEKAGADPARVRQALMGGAAASLILDSHGGRMLARDYAPAFRAELQQKDLNVALSTARDLGIVLPATAAAEQMYNAVRARGAAKQDAIGVVRVLRELAGNGSDD